MNKQENYNVTVKDKTGTLTMGKPKLTSVVLSGTISEERLLLLAASIEKASEHPLAEAIVSGASDKKVQPIDVNE